MCRLVEILCVLQDEIGLLHEIHALKYFWIQPACELSQFSFKLSKLIRYFYWLWETESIWKMFKILKELFDPLETNSLTLMTVLKIFASLFPLQIWQKMKQKGNFKQWFNVFLIISEAWQGYESKGYVVLNHYLKLQPEKFSRTWDISNFPTQGWVDTTFCTINWNCTYIYVHLNMKLLIILLILIYDCVSHTGLLDDQTCDLNGDDITTDMTGSLLSNKEIY